MELLKFVRLIVVLVTMVSGENVTKEMKKHIHRFSPDQQQGVVMCTRLSKEPYFGIDMLLGKPWRIYYTWNMDLENICLDMTFMNATLAIINRIYNDMNEYLDSQPNWDAASLLVRMGRQRHEMLLFVDQGPAGRFQGVPNIVSDASIYPEKRTVPLLRFHLKLINGGKYLLMADCEMGVTTLSTRKKKLPNRAEIGDIASNVDLGCGHHTCQADKNMNENVSMD